MQSVKGISNNSVIKESFRLSSLLMLILPIDCKLHKRCPRLGMQGLSVYTLSANSIPVFYLYIAAEMCLNLEPIFEKSAL